jgi:hypothetical protein
VLSDLHERTYSSNDHECILQTKDALLETDVRPERYGNDRGDEEDQRDDDDSKRQSIEGNQPRGGINIVRCHSECRSGVTMQNKGRELLRKLQGYNVEDHL